MLTKILAWIIENQKKSILLVSLSFVILTILIFLSNNAILLLDVQNNAKVIKNEVYYNTNTEQKKATGQNIVILPRTAKSITVKNGDYQKTQSSITIPWYGIFYKKIVVFADKNGEKIPFLSSIGAACSTYSPLADQLRFYDCRKSNGLFNYQISENGIGTVQNISSLKYSITPPQPFRGGLIGISYFPNTDYITKGDITFVTENGNENGINIPKEMIKDELINAQIFTNSKNTNDNHFVIVDKIGKIYIGTLMDNGDVKYSTIPAPNNYTENYNQTLCAFTDKSVYCYRGRTAFGDYPEAFDFNKVAGSQVVEFTYADGSVKNSNISENLFDINDFQATNSGELYIKINKKVLHLVKKQDKYVLDEKVQNADVISTGNNLLYLQNNGIFIIDKKDASISHQVFYSPNILPKSIYTVNEKIFIIATIKGNPDVTHAYLLNNEINSTPGSRLIDHVPLNEEVNSNVYTSDTFKDLVYVTIFRPKGIATEEMTLRIASKKAELINYFQEKAVSIEQNKIIVN